MEKRITKSNALINSSYRLSLNELRIVLFGLSHINPRTEEFPLFYEIRVKDLAEFYNIGGKERGSFYDDIKNALVNKFWEREFSYFDTKLNKTVKRRWLIEVQYGGKDGVLSYYYNPLIKEQLQNLSKRFTSYFLSNITNMKSAYSIRIYEIVVMYLNASKQDKKIFQKTIDELKTYLDLHEKYHHFFNFKARVLEVARKEINKYSDLNFDYRVVKIGRTPNKVEFIVSRRNQKLIPQPKHSITDLALTSKVVPEIIEKAKKIVLEANTGWDVYVIEQQFYEYMEKVGKPENLKGAFLGFVRKKVRTFP